MSGLERLGRFNIKLVWIVVLLSMLLPSFVQFGLPVAISPMTVEFYDFFENLPEGQTVFIMNSHSLMSYYPLKGALVLTTKLLMEKNCKLVLIAITQEAPVVYPDWMQAANPESYGYKYGEDYVLFGYLAGTEMALAAFAADPWKAYEVDYYGTPLSELPLMQNIHSWEDFDVALGSASSCVLQDMFVRQWCAEGKQNPIDDPYGPNLATVYIPQSTCAPNTVPYYKANPGIHAMIYGTQGAAELEAEANRLGLATALADAKNLGVIANVGLVILGNIAYFAERNRRRKEMET
jgi:hypothetical protein